MALRTGKRAAAGVVHADAMVAQDLHQPPAFDGFEFMNNAVAILDAQSRALQAPAVGGSCRRYSNSRSFAVFG